MTRTEHNRRLCDKRDENNQLLCAACLIREDVLCTIYHEIAHICFDSFAPTSDDDRKQAILHAIDEVGDKYAAKVRAKIKSAPAYVTSSYIGLSTLVSPYLPMLVNCIEDARVNSELFKARKGTRLMFEGNEYRIFEKGVEQKDAYGIVKVIKWYDYPLNSQIMVGILCKLSGYDYSRWFRPEIVEALGDKELTSILNGMATVRTAKAAYELAFPVLARVRELGFCKAPEDPEPDEENTGGDTDDSGEGDSDESPEQSAGSDSAESSDDGSDGSGDADSDPENDGEAPSDDSEGSGDSEESDAGSSGGDSEAPSDPDAEGDEAGDEPDDASDGGDGADDDDAGAGDEDRGGAESDVAGDATDSDDEDDAGGSGGDAAWSSDLDGEVDGDTDEDAEQDEPGGSGITGTGDSGPDLADGEGDTDGGSGNTNSRGDEPGERSQPEDSPAESGADNGDDLVDDEIDTGADDGTGGVEVISEEPIDYGTPEDCARGLKVFGDHEEKPKTVEARRDESAVEKAIVQGMYFETPSTNILGVREHYWGSRSSTGRA